MNRLAKYMLLVLIVTSVSADELPEGAWVPYLRFIIDADTHARRFPSWYGLTFSRVALMRKEMKYFFRMPTE